MSMFYIENTNYIFIRIPYVHHLNIYQYISSIYLFSIDMRNDARRFWQLRNLLWLPYERFEFTRLNRVRIYMDQHMSYDKEEMVNMGKQFENQNAENKEKEHFIWTYIIRPMRKGTK